MRCGAVLLGAMVVAGAWCVGEPATRPVRSPASRPAVSKTTKTPVRTPRTSRRQPAAATTEAFSREEREQAQKLTQMWVDRVAKAADVELARIETDHFQIFHNWDKREERFLEENAEGCYRAIARQFDVAVEDAVFPEKPPLFMIAGSQPFAAALGDVAPDLDAKFVVGFAITGRGGQACMIMSKPTKRDSEDFSRTEKRWATTLAHEMTHLFASRWHGERRLPAWVNEGLAEVMEVRLFPELHTAENLARVLDASVDVASAMELERPRNLQEYGQMQTMCETLINANQRGFVDLVAKLKEGASSEEALEECFGWTVGDFQARWQAWLHDAYKVRVVKSGRSRDR